MTIKVTYKDTLPLLPASAKDIKLKLDRASKHIHDLHAIITAFTTKNPHRIRLKADLQTREDVIYIEALSGIPEEVPIIAGDALQNIRSALDYLAYIIYPGKKTDKIYFPIADSAIKYNSPGFHGHVERFGAAIAKRIDGINPYKGGNDFLWRLNELNKIDKHRLVISAVFGVQDRRMTSADIKRIIKINPKLAALIGGALDWTDAGLPAGPLKIGDELYRGPKLSLEEKKNMQFRVQVSFNEPAINEREPIVPSLSGFHRAVEVVCRKFADLL